MAAVVEEKSPSERRWLLIPVLALVFGAVVWLLPTANRDSPPAAIQTLAVLPLDDLSQGQDFGYFADGMQEELLARLAGLQEVSVLSRTSAERFRDADTSIRDISRMLGADGIIEGSVRLSDERIRVTVQLINGQSDTHSWADSYEEQLTVENVFAIQERVADSIATALQTELFRQQTTAQGLPTTDIAA